MALIIAAALETTGVPLHAGDLEHSLMKEKKIGLHMFFFSFLCSAIPNLHLGILKMLVRVFFRDVSLFKY